MEYLNQFQRNINKCEVRREKYVLPDLFNDSDESSDANEYPALREPPFFTEPVECTWAFMSEDEVNAILKSRNLDKIKGLIDKKLSSGYPKAFPRMIASSLLYTGVKFAKSTNYNAAQTGAILSMFYMTFRFFNSCHRTTAEDVYYFFKELLCYHSLEFSSTHKLVFNPDEAHLLLSFFCKIFLRHLPIIRLLGLPNFQFAIDTYIPPFPVFKKKPPPHPAASVTGGEKEKKKEKKEKGGKGKGKKKK